MTEVVMFAIVLSDSQLVKRAIFANVYQKIHVVSNGL